MVRLHIACIVGCASLLASASLKGADDPSPVDRLKSATVLVRVVGQRGESSGSGFLHLRDKQRGYIVTNSHVAMPDGQKPQRLSVVFASGTSQALELSAEVVANDADSDLALLLVETKKSLPEPIVVREDIKLTETMEIYIGGFPFGDLLKTARHSPNISVSKGTISSLRKDAFDQLALVQIDGNINPGNSGGPVVNAESALVGVAVAKVSGTQIGFAVPVSKLRAMLDGRVGGVTYERRVGTTRASVFDVSCELQDPLDRVASARLLVAATFDLTKLKPNDDGVWGQAAQPTNTLALKKHNQLLVGELAFTDKPGQKMLVQLELTGHDRRRRYLEPMVYVEDSGIVSLARAGSMASGNNSDWLVNPDPRSSGKAPSPPDRPRAAPETMDVSAVASAAGYGNAKASRLKSQGATFQACLARDGKAIYLLDSSSKIGKVTLPGLRKVAQAKVEGGTSGFIMNTTAAGILTMDRSSGGLTVHDAESLVVLRRYDAWGFNALYCGAESTQVIVGKGSEANRVIACMDLESGRLKEYSSKDLQDQLEHAKRHASAKRALPYPMLLDALTPDGDHFLTVASGCLWRFGVRDGKIEVEEASARLGKSIHALCISPDSKYVAVTVEEPVTSTDSAGKPLPRHSFHIYAINDLQSTKRIVPCDSSCRRMAFDFNRQKLYCRDAENHLVVLGLDGKQQDAYRFSDSQQPNDVDFITGLHSNGVLVIANLSPYWVEFIDNPE